MANRARYETKDGEHLHISRGVLTIRAGETGEVYTMAGEPSYDRKSKQLSVPVLVKDKRVTIEFDIVKTLAEAAA